MGMKIFSTCKPFGIDEQTDITQHNSIGSWTMLREHMANHDLIIFGDEPGVAEKCEELDILNLPINRRIYGHPRIDELFGHMMDNYSDNEVCVYVNADIIITEDFLPAVQAVEQEFDKFLMVGQRWDMKITELIDFTTNWQYVLRDRQENGPEPGQWYTPAGMDYFAFKGQAWRKMLPYAIGYWVWDMYLTAWAYSCGTPLIRATEAFVPIHHWHGPASWGGDGPEYNRSLGGPVGDSTHAPWKLDKNLQLVRVR
jgi:hypothetical protein